MLTPYLPYPLHSGGQIRTYNLLKNLSSKHEITLFSFIREPKEAGYLPELKKFCYKIKVFKRRPAWSPKNILLAGFSPYPFVLISTYFSFRVRRAVQQELQSGQYDLIHAEPFYMAPNIPKTKIPTLLVEQTIEYAVYQKFAEDFSLSFLKPFLYYDILKLKLWEKHYWRQADRLVAMSLSDRRIMQQVIPDKPVNVVANGVDIEFFSQVKRKKLKHPTVLFIGQFKWLPNIDATHFLVNDIWPRIKQQLPQAKLWIVGRNPTPEILKLANKDIKVTGDLPDIRQAHANATILLAPIRNGRGTKYKVLESMAAGLPVVTTPLGAKGLQAKAEEHLIIEKTADQLAKRSVELLQDPARQTQLASAAKKFITEKYNWQRIALDLHQIYQELGGQS